MNLTKHILTILTVFCVLGATHAMAAGDSRVALVIGNGAYEGRDALKNPENDARAVAAKLEGLGFDVIAGYNLDLGEMTDSVKSFAKKSRAADVAIIYYAGHGISDEAGQGYLVPVGAVLEDMDDIEFEAYAVADMFAYAQRANNASLIFLDACRDFTNLPPSDTRSTATRTISRLVTEKSGTTGTVIAYATEPGDVAYDGEGANSPFTSAILDHLGAANTDFASITSRITRDVLEATDNKQRPRFDVSLNGPLILNEVATPVVAQNDGSTVPAPPTSGDAFASLEVQKYLFELAKESNDAADYQVYLDQFPTGMFAANARNAIVRLEASQVATAPAAPVISGGSTNYAALAPAPPTAPRTRMASVPLQLIATDQFRMAAGTEQTQQAMAMSKTKRKEVQLRLNLSGHNVGRPDGAFGPKTRQGIANWQMQNGTSGTGYLNMAQLQLLTASTETSFRSHMAANPNALKSAPARVSSAPKKSNNQVGAFALGAAVGAIGASILGR